MTDERAEQDRPQWTPHQAQGGGRPETQKWWQRRFALPVWSILGGAVVLIAAGTGLGSAPTENTSTSEPGPVPTVTVTVTERETLAAEPEPEDEAPAEEPAVEGDASASVACRHFRNVMGDASRGILNEQELREKLQEVYDSGWVSETPGIAPASEALLAAATQVDADALLEAVERMDEACSNAGL